MREILDSRYGGLVHWCWEWKWESLWDRDRHRQSQFILRALDVDLLCLATADGLCRSVPFWQTCGATAADHVLDDGWSYYCFWFVFSVLRVLSFLVVIEYGFRTVVGYSWINTHLPVISNLGVGVTIGWKRA
jgi:hypothetical protein